MTTRAHDRLTGRTCEATEGWTGRWADGAVHCLDPAKGTESRDAIESDDLDALEALGQSLVTAFEAGTWSALRSMPLLSKHDVDDLEPQHREHSLHAHLPSIARVCERFVTRLSERSELLPVARVRRPARKALERLSSHTEDWATRTLSGPVPRRALAVTLEHDADLYENRMVTELVHPILTTALAQRIRRLRRLTSDLADLVRADDEGTYRRRNRLYAFWGVDSAHAAQSSAHASHTLQFLESLAARTHALRESSLALALRGKRTGQRTLRLTNVIANDRHYRAAGLVWNEYEREQEPAETAEQREDRLRARHRTFDQYVLGLIVRALEGHAYRPVEDRIPSSDAAVTIHGRWGSATLERSGDGVIVLRRGAHATRFVPLLDVMAPEDDSASVGQRWTSIAGLAGPPTVVVYLAASADVRRLPSPVATPMSSAGPDSPEPSPVTGVPVSPLETTSLERISRAVGLALMVDALLDYPRRIHIAGERLPRRLVGQLDAANITQPGLSDLFHRRGSDEIFLRRPLTASESARFETTRRSLLDRTRSPGWERDVAREIDALDAAIRAASSAVAELLCCPLCGTVADPTRVGREADILVVTCPSCAARWGHERCGSCEARIPFIEPENKLLNPDVTGPGWVERIYGQDALASPCWARTIAGRYICPTCRRCPVTAAPQGAACVRCHFESAPSAS